MGTFKKKGKLRNIKINGEDWKWIVEAERWAGAVAEVRIYSPQKKMFRVDGKDLTDERTWVGIEGDFATNIKPSDIKSHILNELI